MVYNARRKRRPDAGQRFQFQRRRRVNIDGSHKRRSLAAGGSVCGWACGCAGCCAHRLHHAGLPRRCGAALRHNNVFAIAQPLRQVKRLNVAARGRSAGSAHSINNTRPGRPPLQAGPSHRSCNVHNDRSGFIAGRGLWRSDDRPSIRPGSGSFHEKRRQRRLCPSLRVTEARKESEQRRTREKSKPLVASKAAPSFIQPVHKSTYNK